MPRCQICRLHESRMIRHIVIVWVQADFKIWVETLAVRPSRCRVPSGTCSASTISTSYRNSSVRKCEIAGSCTR